MTDKHILLGTIVGTHGVHGRVRVKTFTSSPENLDQYGDLHDKAQNIIPLKVTSTKSDTLVIAQVEGITRKEHAEQIVGTDLFVPRANLPESTDDEIYIEDLVGMKVIDAESQKPAGVVLSVENYGAGDILEIEFPSGQTDMFIFDDKTFPSLDAEKRIISFNCPDVEFVETKKE